MAHIRNSRTQNCLDGSRDGQQSAIAAGGTVKLDAHRQWCGVAALARAESGRQANAGNARVAAGIGIADEGCESRHFRAIQRDESVAAVNRLNRQRRGQNQHDFAVQCREILLLEPLPSRSRDGQCFPVDMLRHGIGDHLVQISLTSALTISPCSCASVTFMPVWSR